MATTATYMMSQAAAISDFQNFSFFLIFELNTENGEKTTFSDLSLQIVRFNVKL